MNAAEDTATGPLSAGASSTGRDIVAMGIAMAAIVLFVGTGGAVLPQAIGALLGNGGAPDPMLANAVLLNIALIIFGWRRYRELVREVTERRKAEEQARVLSELDPLTGCLNRRSIGPEADRMISEATSRGDAVAFVMFDLDRFKQVNDVFGHKAGDQLLRESAERLHRQIGKSGLVARLGGDEFAAVVPFAPERSETVAAKVDEIIRTIALPVLIEGRSVETSVSAGVCVSNAMMPEDAQTLLHHADIAMYQAKRGGRNRQAWFEPSMENEVRFRAQLESGMRHGLSAGEFTPYYEKQIDLETGEIVGFEMLARWQSPTLGSISPEVFIPLAEEIGLIGELSEILIRQALRDARTWNPKLTLAVNISPVQLRDPWFSQRLLKLLVEANFPPSRFEIEITESCLHENIALVQSLVISLKNQGIKVSLDDFGTGYSSLSQLRSLPFDRLKIDRSFIMNLIDNPENDTIVRSIVALGKGLNIPITIEGVETDTVLEKVKELGNFKVQGYLYGRPSPASKTQQELQQLDLLHGPPNATPAPASESPEDEKRQANG